MAPQEIILAELGLTEVTPQITIDMARVEQVIQNYCHLAILPHELNFTIADMVLDLQRMRSGDNLTLTEVKMGDTSYNFKVDKAIEGLVKDYKKTLTKFRVMP